MNAKEAAERLLREAIKPLGTDGSIVFFDRSIAEPIIQQCIDSQPIKSCMFCKKVEYFPDKEKGVSWRMECEHNRNKMVVWADDAIWYHRKFNVFAQRCSEWEGA